MGIPSAAGDFLRVWAWAKQANPSYPSVSLVAGFFALDIAGLAHARRSRPQTA